MNRHRYNNVEELRRIVLKSKSKSEVLTEYGLKPVGGNYKVLNKYLYLYNISVTHFNGKGWNTGDRYIQVKSSIPLSDILVEYSTFSTYHLKRKLLNEGIKTHKCECCNNTTWNDKPIPLELNHKNGVHTDHRLNNIELLCPNCHALTDHYRGRNKNRYIR